MSFRKQNSTILVCVAGFFIASMGFSLSVLAVIAALLTSAIVALFSSGQPIIETRDAAVKASTHSPPGSLRRKVTSPSTPRKSPGKLRIDVTREVKAHPRSETDLTSRDPLTAATPDVTGEVKVHPQSEADLTSRVSTAVTANQHAVHSPVASPHQPSVRFLSSPVGSPNHPAGSFHSPTQETTHFRSPTQEIPSIAISPPPTRLSHHSDSSRASTEINTLSSGDSSHSSPPAAEPRGRRRLRFSKIVHLFGDKRTKIDRRLSLSSLPSDAAPPAPSPPASLASSPSSPPASSATCRRQTKLMTRVASCPIILHHHHHHSSVDAPHESSAEDPTRGCPLKKGEKKEKEKEAAPRPRTQPYAAPYFIPPPDSVDVEDPIPRRRPSRRRTMPPPERRTSGL